MEATDSLVTVNVSSRYVEGRSISMYPDDWWVVDRIAEILGVGTSAVMRMMVRESTLPQQYGIVGRNAMEEVGDDG